MKKMIFCCLCWMLALGLGAQQPWFDESKPLVDRVNLLIGHMTIEEKVSQMMNDAPAIERLGIEKYNWWNECLHGVARAGLATVYPQAIALAATFDDNALFKTASIISDEARAKHHQFLRQGSREIYQGLTFWSPNINIFRDPRWGRGQETYGEDPYLTSRMGIAFVKGLQGDHPDYYKVVATAKHFAVHSGPEYERHTFDATASEYDLWDTYLPAFKALVDQANVASVMCAYNRFEGEPCCGSNALQIDILRNKWNFKGYIASDCGAIDDFYKTHKTSATAEDASAIAVRAGTDLECGDSYKALLDAVNQRLISEQEIDISLRRLFYARFKLGMFDKSNRNPYASIPYSIVDCDLHRQDALDMARKSIVLLKNDNNILPLSKSIKRIAVVGPGATDSISILGNYNGKPGVRVSILDGIRSQCGGMTEVFYNKGVNFLDENTIRPIDIWSMFRSGNATGLRADYFSNIKLEGKPIYSRIERQLDFQGGVEDEIAPGIKANWISVRWSGDFIPEETTEYTFNVSGDDGFRLFINDEKVIDHFSYHEEMSDIYTLPAEKGQRYAIRLEYFQGDQGAAIRFNGGYLNKTDYNKVAQEAAESEVIIFVGGISPMLEGEEMPVNLPGFRKGDRTTMNLPEVQTRMLKALHATGKPVVFVMQTGSPIAINWEKENIPAIINAWYGGQSIGTAIADVLFGNYNPAGRLPVTFYKSDSDLPPYQDYSMENRTYRYFKGEPLFAFGHGLSYTTFKYDNLKVNKSLSVGQNLSISVTVTNNGAYDGDEVVQLYISHPNSQDKTPQCAFKNFKRIFLKKGESKELVFTLSPSDMAVIDRYGEMIQRPGELIVFVGGGQPKYAPNGQTAPVLVTGHDLAID